MRNKMKFVVILAPGFEEIEALSPVDYLRRAGAEVVVAGIEAKGESFVNTITGARGIKVECDMSFDEFLSSMNGELPDGIIIPGGMPGAANIGSNKSVLDYLKKMNEAKKLVCAICAAPVVVLAQTGILAGKQFTCYPGMEQDLEKYVPDISQIPQLMNGAVYNDDKPFVHDQNVITGRGPGAAEQFSMEIVRTAFGDNVMNVVKQKSVQR